MAAAIDFDRVPEIRVWNEYPEIAHDWEVIIDAFAGGGGTSTGLEDALDRSADVAINHSPQAIAMHQANHPDTHHMISDIWAVDPVRASCGKPIGLAWFSPDCRHYSKAHGTAPVSKSVRALAYVIVDWATLKPERNRPRVIMLENVREFQEWGPLKHAHDKAGKPKWLRLPKKDGGGYDLDADGNQKPFMVPDPTRKGEDFDNWTAKLRAAGYKMEWRLLSADEYGTPTTRTRFFMIARRDGEPIVWPEPTHGTSRPGLEPVRPASSIIDWSIPTRSIFDRTRKCGSKKSNGVPVETPCTGADCERCEGTGSVLSLAEQTLRRASQGVWKFVIDAADPYVVPDFMIRTGHYKKGGAGDVKGKGAGTWRGQMLDKPLATVCGTNDKNLIQAFVRQVGGDEVVALSYVMKNNGGKIGAVGQPLDTPLHTITGRDQKSLVTALLMRYNGEGIGSTPDRPLQTITGKARFALVDAKLQASDKADPKSKVAKLLGGAPLLTVNGVRYEIVDIGMRMLAPHELFGAQGFDADYVIDPIYKGKPLTQTAQVMCAGNSVCPPMAKALIAANVKIRRAA